MEISPQMSREQEPLELKAFYFPVIVTNRELFVCEFDPSDVDISEGALQERAGEFKPVPFIRFQKSFTTRYTTPNLVTSLQDANKQSQRTVLIVSASQLPEFLRQWNLY
jgi:hypothetical protein